MNQIPEKISWDIPRFENHDDLAEPLRQGRLGDFQAKSDLASCLLPLLNALGWKRDLREIAEALPHFADALTVPELRNVLANLGYKTVRIPITLRDIDPRLMPCLFISEESGASVLLKATEEGLEIFDGYANLERTIQPGDVQGDMIVVVPGEQVEEEQEAREENWFGESFKRFKGLFLQLAGMSMMINFLALTTPIFVMTVYDRVIPNAAYETLAYLALGVSFIFLVDVSLKILRSRVVSYVAGRIERIIAASTFSKILRLPAQLTEGAPLGAQISRLREFDSIRDIFIGPFTTVVLEAPFTIIFLVTIAILGSWLAVIPLAMVILYVVMGFYLIPRLKDAVSKVGRARVKRHSYMVETAAEMRTIREAKAEAHWLDRYKSLSADVAYYQFKASQISYLFQNLSQAIMTLSALLTIVFGAYMVTQNILTIGALIAVMALIWRTLSPLQNAFLSLARYEQIKQAVKQINQMMSLKAEVRAIPKEKPVISRRLAGAVNMLRVSFRYRPNTEPALFSVSLAVKPGTFLSVTGPNGAGKTTLLRVIMGLQTPQAGQIVVDGMDIRQLDIQELRQSIGYVPQYSSFFHGSIAQNLRLANPVASDDDLKEALHMAGALDDVLSLPNGLETRMGDHVTGRVYRGLQQRLALARAYVKQAPILLLDEPAQALDEKGDKALMATLKRLKGNTTIIMVTHRPSHIRMSDELAVMSGGMILVKGEPEGVMAKLAGGTS